MYKMSKLCKKVKKKSNVNKQDKKLKVTKVS